MAIRRSAFRGAGPVVGFVLALAAVGCSDSPDEADAGPSTISTPGSFATPETRPVAAVGTGDSALGKIAVDIEGYALYRSDQDSNDPPESSCVDPCTDTWRPLLTEDGMPIALPGVDPGELAVLERENGEKQVTLAGWPLYRYAGDNSAGKPSGDGMDDTWHAVAPDGSRAGAKQTEKENG